VNTEARRYLPVAIACVVIVALIVLGYEAGYHAGKAAATHARHATNARP
jgi:hypothetical protein